MTADELAKMHPILFHVTDANNWPSIQKHGLLSTKCLLDLFEIPPDLSLELSTKKRFKSIPITHPIHGTAMLTDNIPLNDKCLSERLDDGLTLEDWYLMLNSRVFLFANMREMNKLRTAASNRSKVKMVLEFDTLKLAKVYGERMELSPINSGTANPRSVPRRGLATFSPLQKYSKNEWQRLRKEHKKARDYIQEVVVLDAVRNIEQYLIKKS